MSVINSLHGNRFEIYTLVSEIHDNVYLAFGIKNVYEIETVVNNMGLKCTLPEKINSFLSKDRCDTEAKGTEIYSN